MHVCGRVTHVFLFSLTFPCRLTTVFFLQIASLCCQPEGPIKLFCRFCLSSFSILLAPLPPSVTCLESVLCFFFISMTRKTHLCLSLLVFERHFLVLCCYSLLVVWKIDTIKTLERTCMSHLHTSCSVVGLWVSSSCVALLVVSCMLRCVDLRWHAGDWRRETLPSVWNLASTFSFNEKCFFFLGKSDKEVVVLNVICVFHHPSWPACVCFLLADDQTVITLLSLTAAVKIKKPIKTKFRMPVFNWVALKPNQINGTVFNEIDDERILEVSVWLRQRRLAAAASRPSFS